ncbi:MAG: S8 family serine peptidase, partial [Mycobacterium sp.]
MGLTAVRVARVLAVSGVTALPLFGMPSALAISPPEIDDRWLPKPALPAPPRPTVQREICAMLAEVPATGHGQIAVVDLPRVWQLSRGAGQRVAVIDTGVSRHRRLPGVVPGGDYVFTGDGTQDCDAHGTLVAGIIAAAPDSEADGLGGVAPDATVISIRQSSAKFGFASNSSSSGVGDVDTMARAVRTAADLGASVINISSVACVPVASALDDRALGASLAYAVDVKNAVIVA